VSRSGVVFWSRYGLCGWLRFHSLPVSWLDHQPCNWWVRTALRVIYAKKSTLTLFIQLQYLIFKVQIDIVVITCLLDYFMVMFGLNRWHTCTLRKHCGC
jgi:hypothetical protein